MQKSATRRPSTPAGSWGALPETLRAELVRDTFSEVSELAPGILIAAPPMGDPNFDRSVVLLASHDEEGAFGWVINGAPVLSIRELLEQAGFQSPVSDEPSLSGSVLRGGPVSTEQVWLVYPAEKQLDDVAGQIEITPGIYATASRDFLTKIQQGLVVPGLRAFAGYAGWAGGQLEGEIQLGGWLPGAVESHLIFETEPKDIWQQAYQLQGTNPFSFTSRTVGSA